MRLIKDQIVNNNLKQQIIFKLFETNNINSTEPEAEFGICVLSEDDQIDFSFTRSEIDEIIGFLKGIRKHIVQRETVKVE